MKRVIKQQWALAWGAAAALVACGGGGGSPLASNTLGEAPAVQVATFIDAPVAGLEYESPSTSGLTATDALDANGNVVKQSGNFEFVPGETVTFTAGNLLFGSVEMREGMTEVRPTDLVPGADVSDPRVVRMLQTLQSLDADGNPDNGIHIADGDREHLRRSAAHVDLREPSVSDDEVKALLPTMNYTVDAQAAVAHFERHLDDESHAANGFTPPGESIAGVSSGGLSDSSDGSSDSNSGSDDSNNGADDTSGGISTGGSNGSDDDSSTSGSDDSASSDSGSTLPTPVTPPSSTPAPISTSGRLLASNCFQCHGTGGTGGFENIRGGEASEVFEYFSGQEGAANRSIMTAHAQGFTRQQLEAIVAYLKP